MTNNLLGINTEVNQSAETSDPDQATVAPVLIPELTTENSTTYRLADGSYRSQLSLDPMNYKIESDEWSSVDPTLGESPDPGIAAETVAGKVEVQIPHDAGENPVEVISDDHWVTMKLIGLDDGPEIDENVAVFDRMRNADIVTYEASANGVKETIVLSSAPPVSSPPLVYRADLRSSPGLSAQLDESGAVVFVDRAGEVQFSIPVGNMEDSASPEPAFTTEVGYELSQNDDGWALVVRPSMDWLSDPDRVYPVRIDPTITAGDPGNAGIDCTLIQEQPTTTRCGWERFIAGMVGSGERRHVALRFPLEQIVPHDATIESARIRLTTDPTYLSDQPGTEARYAIYRAGAAFSGNATWSSPAKSPGPSTWVGGSPAANASSGERALRGTSENQHWFTVTDLVKTFHASPATYTGFILKQTTNVPTARAAFFSDAWNGSSQANRLPLLEVTYQTANHPPGAPELQQLVPSTDSHVFSSAPTMHATASDIDGDMLHLTFQVLQGGRPIWSQNTSPMAAGATTSATVPESLLEDGAAFAVRVTASDGLLSSSSTSETYVVDLSPNPESTDIELVPGTTLADLGPAVESAESAVSLVITSPVVTDGQSLTVGINVDSETDISSAVTELLTLPSEELLPDDPALPPDPDDEFDNEPEPLEPDRTNENIELLLAEIESGQAIVTDLTTNEPDAYRFESFEGSGDQVDESGADALDRGCPDRSEVRWWPKNRGIFAYNEYYSVTERYRGHIEMGFRWRARALSAMLCGLKRPTYEHEFRTDNSDGRHIFGASDGRKKPFPDVYPKVDDWYTNMPSGYLDVILSDFPSTQMYAVGTHDAQKLRSGVRYYIKMHTEIGNVGVDRYKPVDQGGAAAQVGTHFKGCWTAVSCIFGKNTKVFQPMGSLTLPKNPPTGNEV